MTLWDAAEKVPPAGADAAQPESVGTGNFTRSLFTGIGGALHPLDAASAALLQEPLNVNSRAEAEMIVHALRGRRGGSIVVPAGHGEDLQRLGNFRSSSPLVVGASKLSPVTAMRDRVLYVGADDGLLHAFFVSGINEESGQYLVDDPDGGVELWGFLPGSFLPYLQEQPMLDAAEELIVSLDGSPQVREVFIDLDRDGMRSWHTLLAASGTVLGRRRSCLFVLDVTDPYQPKLLWEKLLPGDGTGRTRGVRLGACKASPTGCLYLSADSADPEENGLHVLALALDSGQLLWQFNAPYDQPGSLAGATPAVPVLANLVGGKDDEVVVLGDMRGRLWVIEAASGEALGGAPVFTTPGGLSEPIGGEVAVINKTVIFSSGGVETADPDGEYSLYAVEIEPQGARLRWTYPLQRGEKVWQAPQFDSHGNLVLATSRGYHSAGPIEEATSGRVVVLNKDGEEIARRETGAATIGHVVTAPGVVLSVDLTGVATQFGSPSRLGGPTTGPGTVRVLSWRQR